MNENKGDVKDLIFFFFVVNGQILEMFNQGCIRELFFKDKVIWLFRDWIGMQGMNREFDIIGYN